MSRAIIAATLAPNIAGPSRHAEDNTPASLEPDQPDGVLPAEEPNITDAASDVNNLNPQPPQGAEPIPNDPPPSRIETILRIISDAASESPDPDHISIEFHPSTKKAPKIVQMHEYSPLTYHETRPAPQPKIDNEPWSPFRTRLDFEVAELALNTHMNKGHINVLFALIRKCIKNPDDLTLRTASEVEKVWTAARTCHGTGVSAIIWIVFLEISQKPFSLTVCEENLYCLV